MEGHSCIIILMDVSGPRTASFPCAVRTTAHSVMPMCGAYDRTQCHASVRCVQPHKVYPLCVKRVFMPSAIQEMVVIFRQTAALGATPLRGHIFSSPFYCCCNSVSHMCFSVISSRLSHQVRFCHIFFKAVSRRLRSKVKKGNLHLRHRLRRLLSRHEATRRRRSQERHQKTHRSRKVSQRTKGVKVSWQNKREGSQKMAKQKTSLGLR